jgi:hypothetical protein
MPNVYNEAVSKTMVHAVPPPSPSMNEGVLGEIAPGDRVMYEAAEALRQVRLAAENSRKAALAVHADLTMSEGARHVRADEFSHKLTMAALPSVDKAATHVQTEINRLRLKIAAPVCDGTMKTNLMHGEIRSRLAGMSSGDRMVALNRAIAEDDDLVISAALEASPMLTNLTAPELEHVRLMFQRKRFSAELVKIASLQKTHEHLQRGGTLLQNFQRTCSKPEIVQAAKRSQAAANEAVASASVVH